MALKMTREDLEQFIKEVFPQVAADFTVEDAAPMEITMRLNVGERHLRPGGTVSGPSMFGLADVAIYLAIMAMIGPKALAVTTNASFDFMRKPAAGVDLIAKCRLLKLGRVLAVGDVLLYSEGMAEPVARASMTYSIPPGP
ncbi:MAG: PaaI family thioesterase [Rhodobacterales bacterium]|nr:PaaI family thioesterase [Rhodobacterales bacterium]MDX5413700.1 PaaI family thioesterase [Rhodobacterales bacterium]